MRNLSAKLGVKPLLTHLSRAALALCLLLYFAFQFQDFQPRNAALAKPFFDALFSEFILPLHLLLLIYGCLAFAFEIFSYFKRLRMSPRELKDETKEQYGDPLILSKRRRLAQERLAQLIKGVKNSSVIIVNPTHYAFGVEWKQSAFRPPHCSIKGIDQAARRIRKLAEKFEIPIHVSPLTARELFKHYAVGQLIEEQHFRAVASSIIFAENLKRISRESKGRTRQTIEITR